jgi:hypothetical protein
MMIGWTCVVLFQVVLSRDEALADEALHGGQQEIKGFGIKRHHGAPGQRC